VYSGELGISIIEEDCFGGQSTPFSQRHQMDVIAKRILLKQSSKESYESLF
jgi:hypothetical protein